MCGAKSNEPRSVCCSMSRQSWRSAMCAKQPKRLIGYRQRIAANHPTIAELLQPIQDLTYITRLIRGVIDDRSRVKDSASRELTEVRQQLAVFDEKIQNEFRRLLRSAEIRKSLRYPQPTMCGDHHVLAVAINYRHMVPGIVHRTSPTGETIFVEPAKIAQISADVIHLKNVEEREVRRVLRQLTSSIGQDAKRIQATLGIVAEVDFVASKGRFGLKHNMHVAHLSTEPMLRLQDAATRSCSNSQARKQPPLSAMKLKSRPPANLLKACLSPPPTRPTHLKIQVQQPPMSPLFRSMCNLVMTMICWSSRDRTPAARLSHSRPLVCFRR